MCLHYLFFKFIFRTSTFCLVFNGIQCLWNLNYNFTMYSYYSTTTEWKERAILEIRLPRMLLPMVTHWLGSRHCLTHNHQSCMYLLHAVKYNRRNYWCRFPMRLPRMFLRTRIGDFERQITVTGPKMYLPFDWDSCSWLGFFLFRPDPYTGLAAS